MGSLPLAARPQLTAFFTSAMMRASSTGVSSFSAKATGHRAPSSRFAAVVETERGVPGLELLRALEEADDLAVPGIGGHPVPGLRREGRRAGFDERMEPSGHGAIRFRQRRDGREHGAFPVGLVLVRPRFRLQLPGASLHGGAFIVRESRGGLAVADCCVSFFGLIVTSF